MTVVGKGQFEQSEAFSGEESLENAHLDEQQNRVVGLRRSRRARSHFLKSEREIKERGVPEILRRHVERAKRDDFVAVRVPRSGHTETN